MKEKLGRYQNIIFDSETANGKAEITGIRGKHPGDIIAFASGCFDVGHAGHAIFTEQVRRVGENFFKKHGSRAIVVIGIGRDSIIKELKGKSRPVNTEWNRAYLMASLKDVDYVIIDNKKIDNGKIDFAKTLKLLKPDVFVLNDDDSAINEKRELCNNLGISLELVKREIPDFLEPNSSSRIISRIRDN